MQKLVIVLALMTASCSSSGDDAFRQWLDGAMDRGERERPSSDELQARLRAEMDLDAGLDTCGKVPTPASESNPDFNRWILCADLVRARWCVAYPKACACKPDWFRENVRPGNPPRCAEQNAWVRKKLDGG